MEGHQLLHSTKSSQKLQIKSLLQLKLIIKDSFAFKVLYTSATMFLKKLVSDVILISQ